ncbi:ATP-dependent peptidase [Multifurca ochricompacta]|uniref:ATP-dependent peptidase n=1 Tax=Multifurca ochricompacta TaxID=376703 RepID=A0AAD4MAP4_9AGAM|nr:ATP-dependent peptidase [Multifurca ochricompacta]
MLRFRLSTVPSVIQYQFRASYGHKTRTISYLLSYSHVTRSSFPLHPFQLSHNLSRTISFGSIFSSKPSPTPSPHAVAHVARIEAGANAHPYDVERQLVLFQALSDTNIQPGYELIINRWERMTEFDPTSPLLHSDKAFEYYLQALLKTSKEASINPAVRRRESLLAAHPLTSPSPVLAPQAEHSEVPSATEQQSVPSTSIPTTSRSQHIASSVIAGSGVELPSPSAPGLGSPDQPLSADMAKLLAALGAGQGASGNPVHVIIKERKGAWIPSFARFLVFAGIATFFILTILSVLVENSGLVKAAPRQSEFEPHESSKPVRFSDVHGVDEAKEELKDVVAFLKDPSRFAELGGKLPKGVLLTGEPGTGKTMLARAVAGEAGVPFLLRQGEHLHPSISEFDEMFVGVGAKRVRELFATARKKQPAIIFIDELDAVGGKRSARDQQYMKQTLNQLLVEMDGFLQDEGVIVIAATNFPESLDEALVRPGRFDRHIAVPLPDIRGRAQILVHHMKEIVVGSDVDPMILARGTPGFSGADLQNMVNQAAIQASKEQCKAVALKHLEWAKDRIVMGAERRSSYIDEKVKRLTAYHEGGHALTALYTEGAMPLHKVTCMPRGHALGVTSQLPKDDRLMITQKEFLADIDVALGGRVAEELIFGAENVTSGASSDLRKATATATRMVKNWGYSEKIGPVYLSDREEGISASKREEVESEVRRLLQTGQARVFALLRSKQQELHRLALALIEHETLDMEEVKKVIRGESIRNIKDVISEDLSRLGVPAPEPPSAASAS